VKPTTKLRFWPINFWPLIFPRFWPLIFKND
jgi:hypothetical protein